MRLCEEVRASCAEVAASAASVHIDPARIGAIDPGSEPALDPRAHLVEGPRAQVAAYLLALDAINFGSGWFPTLRKRPGMSGYFTVASSLADRFRAGGPWSPAELRRLDRSEVAQTLGQDERHPLMRLYAEALRDLGRFLGKREPLEVVDAAGGSAEALATDLARGMRFFDDRGFYKRAQIAACDMALGGVTEPHDLHRLTIFADNLVPHVLRLDGVLRYEPRLAEWIDSERLLPAGVEETEIRACAVYACELIAAETGVAPWRLDMALWSRGQERRYKSRPRHRTKTVYY